MIHDDSTSKTAAPPRGPLRWMVTVVVCLGIVSVGWGLYVHLIKSAPKARKRPPAKAVTGVNVVALHPVGHQIEVGGMGVVIPAREMTLKSRVSGQIQYRHPEFVAGGIVSRGQRLLKVDPQDYRLALARQESQLANAQYELKVEMGYQEVARREWSLLGRGQAADPADVELALRKPHLAKARSDLAAARAELEQATLNLKRTDIEAPFNALVRSTHVDVGSQISTQESLAELVGTDEYWIRVSLPAERLQWFDIPGGRSDDGAPATVHYRRHQCGGRVIRLLGDLEPQGRMARVLITVRDPLGLSEDRKGRPALLIGEFVRVVIEGRYLENVVPIPRSALRDGNAIWLAGPDDTLVITPVDVVWDDDRIVLVRDGIPQGARLIVSDLATPVTGMPVSIIADDVTKGHQPVPAEDARRNG